MPAYSKHLHKKLFRSSTNQQLTLSMSNPSKSTQDLFNRLQSTFDKQILSGQTNSNYQRVEQITGKKPIVQSFDMQNYSPHNPWHDDWSSWDDGTVQSAIDFYRNTGGKGIVTFQWHWFSPMGGNQRTSTFYTDSTNFDVSRAVQDGTAENNALIRDLDAIASQLRRLQDADIPILWRPLHEAGGKWFWWGAKGSGPCKALYNIMRNRFINVHKLNNLIWVWSTPEPDWYPGNNIVDILGFDSYPGPNNYNCNSQIYYQMKSITQGQKMLTLSENGPIPDISNCFNSGAKWLYFLTWSDLLEKQNDWNHIQNVYNDWRVIHQ